MDYIVKKNRANKEVKNLLMMELSYHGINTVGDLIKIEDPKELASILPKKRWSCELVTEVEKCKKQEITSSFVKCKDNPKKL